MSESITLGNVTLSPDTGELCVDGTYHRLTKRYVEILRLLMEASPRVVLTSAIHPDRNCAGTYICHLRRQLKQAGAACEIVNSRTFGFLLREKSA